MWYWTYILIDFKLPVSLRTVMYRHSARDDAPSLRPAFSNRSYPFVPLIVVSEHLSLIYAEPQRNCNCPLPNLPFEHSPGPGLCSGAQCPLLNVRTKAFCRDMSGKG